MTIALIDNGSRQPAAHLLLRTLAAALSARTKIPVHAVSWRHSDRIPPEALGGIAAWTLGPWLRTQHASGERDFVVIPFFVSPGGAIGSRLRREADMLTRQLAGCRVNFTPGLSTPGALSSILAQRIQQTITSTQLRQPAAIVVDHGGPSPSSAAVRDQIVMEIRAELGATIRGIAAASLGGSRYAHNRPGFAEVFARRGFDRGDVIIAPLFLAPGRHAGPSGDLMRIAAAACQQQPKLHCHFTELIGTHPQVVELLAAGLPFDRPRFIS